MDSSNLRSTQKGDERSTQSAIPSDHHTIYTHNSSFPIYDKRQSKIIEVALPMLSSEIILSQICTYICIFYICEKLFSKTQPMCASPFLWNGAYSILEKRSSYICPYISCIWCIYAIYIYIYHIHSNYAMYMAIRMIYVNQN